MRCLSENLMRIYFNITSNPQHHLAWEQQQLYQRPFRICVSIFLFISNSLIIIGIVNTNKKLSIAKRLFVYSSVTGVFTSAMSPINSYISLISENCLNEFVSDSILIFLLTFDFCILLIIGIVRYIYLTSPLRRISRQSIKISFTIGFAIALVMGVLFLCLHTSDFPEYFYRMHWLFLGVFTQFCMLCCIVLIGSLWYMLHKNTTILRYNGSSQGSAQFKNHHKAVKRLILMNILYILCNFPMSVTCFTLFITHRRHQNSQRTC